MYSVVFDEEEKVFSVVDTREFASMSGIYNVAKGHVGKHASKYITGGSAALGAGAAAMIARNRAINRARRAGLSEDEARRAGRRAALKGAGLGAVAGGALGYGGGRIYDHYNKLAKHKAAASAYNLTKTDNKALGNELSKRIRQGSKNKVSKNKILKDNREAIRAARQRKMEQGIGQSAMRNPRPAGWRKLFDTDKAKNPNLTKEEFLEKNRWYGIK